MITLFRLRMLLCKAHYPATMSILRQQDLEARACINFGAMCVYVCLITWTRSQNARHSLFRRSVAFGSSVLGRWHIASPPLDGISPPTRGAAILGVPPGTPLTIDDTYNTQSVCQLDITLLHECSHNLHHCRFHRRPFGWWSQPR